MVSTQGYEKNARIGENGEPSPSLNKIQMRWQRGALKVAILTKMANSRQSLTDVPMTWQRDPSESGYFSENGIFGENMATFANRLSCKSKKMARGAPRKVANSDKIKFTKV